jgi:hypothetical protein
MAGEWWRENMAGELWRQKMAGERWWEILGRENVYREIVGGRYVPENICERDEREPYTNPKPNYANHRPLASLSVGR